MIWDIVNSFGRLLVTAIASIIVTALREELNECERAGLGLMGAGSFLTIGVIWEQRQSPFDGWAVTLLTYGVVLFLGGYGWRKLRHHRANVIQKRLSAAYFKAKDKP